MPRIGVIAADAELAPEPASIDNIGRRYRATLFAQALQLASSVVSAGIVPRFLGAADYGNYNFLLNMAGSIRGFSEPSVQQAFFTFSAQEEESGPLSRIYALWVVVQLALLLGVIGVAAALGVSGRIWPGQPLDRILLLTLVDWTMFLVLTLKQLGDSKGLTVRPQMIGAGAGVMTLIGLLGLAASGKLTFYTYAVLNLATAGTTACVLAYWLLVVHGRRCWTGNMRAHARAYFRQWWVYARPLILVEYYTPLIALLGMYLIQVWYGSIEQGQFALGLRWSALVLLFTSSAVMILWREIAAATALQEHRRAGQLYYRFNRLLAFLAIVLATWLAFASPTLVPLLAGAQYVGAIPIVMVMAFYPLAQTIGQLSTAGLKAAGRTAEYQKWALLLSIPDLVLTYVLVAPVTARIPGLGLGALGIAIKMTGFALITVQVYEWALTRHFGLSYRIMLAGYVKTLAVITVVAAATMVVIAGVLQTHWHASAVTALGVSSTSYFLASAAIAFGVPRLVGFSRSELTLLCGRWIR